VALAYRAGARLADLEFVQFHPTALHLAGAPRFLISEAIRGEGARLVNARGEAFMGGYHADGDLAPRDVVARSIAREVERTGGPVFLSLAHLNSSRIRERFPTIADMCRQVGLDLAIDPIPVGPAAHYLMGGIDTDQWGRTSLAGLFAAGEAACTGVHGANRLASNSLLEGLVFGARAADAMLKPLQAAPMKPDRVKAGADRLAGAGFGRPQGVLRHAPEGPGLPKAGAVTAPEETLTLDSTAVRDLMWRSAGLFRTREGLVDAVRRLDEVHATQLRSFGLSSRSSADAWRGLNLLTVALLIARAALRREESRGGHFREDFPARDDLHWQIHLVDQRDSHGQQE
jgi:L-aspartate oxidase